MASIAGVATLVMFGYVVVSSIPDIRRYIRMNTM